MNDFVFQNLGGIFLLGALGLLVAFVPLLILLTDGVNVIEGLLKNIVIWTIGLVSLSALYYRNVEMSKARVNVGQEYYVDVFGTNSGELFLMKKEYSSPEALLMNNVGLNSTSFKNVRVAHVKCGDFTYNECVNKIKDGLSQMVSMGSESSSQVVQF